MKKFSLDAECVCNEDGSCTLTLRTSDTDSCACLPASISFSCSEGCCTAGATCC